MTGSLSPHVSGASRPRPVPLRGAPARPGAAVRDPHGPRLQAARVARFAVGLLLALAAVLPGAPAHADGGAKHVVQAVNEASGTERARSGVQVAPAGGPTVEPENLALARASCVDCRTLAVAMQVVLVTGDANVVSPRNAAVAVNESCVRCQTYAYARQYVVTTGRPVAMSAEAHRRIAQIREQVAHVTASGLAFDVLTLRLDDLYTELQGVVDAAIEAAGATRRGAPARDVRAA